MNAERPDFALEVIWLVPKGEKKCTQISFLNNYSFLEVTLGFAAKNLCSKGSVPYFICFAYQRQSKSYVEGKLQRPCLILKLNAMVLSGKENATPKSLIILITTQNYSK